MKASLVPAAIALAFAAPAFAQTPEALHEHRIILNSHEHLLADAASAKTTGDSWRQWGDDLRASLGTMFGNHFTSVKTVKGAPYSAELSTEVNHQLADGNLIAKKTSGRVYRDGEGRTRQETVVNGEARSIQLRDPVEGSAVMLLPGSKTAVRMPHIAVHKDAKEITLGEGGKKVIVKRIGESDTGDGTRREEVRVHVVRSGDGKEAHSFMHAMPPMPGMGAMGPLGPRLDGVPLLGKGTTTALGVKEFEGVKAEGKSTVHTIPAGEIGNRNPIMVTSESWYSPELQVTVYSRQNDPRHGETVYRLTNIRRGEPAADLFKVPAEYSKRAKG